jgi:hypothetical protein
MWLGYLLSGTDVAVHIPHGKFNKFYPEDVNRVFPAPTVFHPGLHQNVLHVRWVCEEAVGGAFIPFLWRINTKSIAIASDLRQIDLPTLSAARMAKLLEAQWPHQHLWEFTDWSWKADHPELFPDEDFSPKDTMTDKWMKKVYGMHRANVGEFDPHDTLAEYDYNEGEVHVTDALDDAAQYSLRLSFIVILVTVLLVAFFVSILYSGCAAEAINVIIVLIYFGVVAITWVLFPINYQKSGQTPLDIKVAQAEQRYGVQYPEIPR